MSGSGEVLAKCLNAARARLCAGVNPVHAFIIMPVGKAGQSSFQEKSNVCILSLVLVRVFCRFVPLRFQNYGCEVMDAWCMVNTHWVCAQISCSAPSPLGYFRSVPPVLSAHAHGWRIACTDMRVKDCMHQHENGGSHAQAYMRVGDCMHQHESGGLRAQAHEWKASYLRPSLLAKL
eukprot:scaffold18764_cov20-Tisochrysis_lutea.AAC.2